MIILDTSAVLALASRADAHHREATKALEEDAGPFIVPAGILAEAGYMLERWCGPVALDAFLADLAGGVLNYYCGDADLGRVRALVKRYDDLPLGVADATVVACAEETGAPILTFDRHFDVVAREGTVAVVHDA